jgi:hypothetical protein
MPHLYTLPWAPYMAIIRSRLKKGNLMPWWGLYTLSDLRESNEEPSKVCFENLLKNPNLHDIRSKMIWFKIVPFRNYPRWHDRHFKIHKYKLWFGISLMLASYLWNYVFTLVLNLHSRTSKGPSVGEFVDDPYSKFLTVIISRMREGYNKFHAHFKY